MGGGGGRGREIRHCNKTEFIYFFQVPKLRSTDAVKGQDSRSFYPEVEKEEILKNAEDWITKTWITKTPRPDLITRSTTKEAQQDFIESLFIQQVTTTTPIPLENLDLTTASHLTPPSTIREDSTVSIPTSTEDLTTVSYTTLSRPILEFNKQFTTESTLKAEEDLTSAVTIEHFTTGSATTTSDFELSTTPLTTSTSDLKPTATPLIISFPTVLTTLAKKNTATISNSDHFFTKVTSEMTQTILPLLDEKFPATKAPVNFFTKIAKS